MVKALDLELKEALQVDIFTNPASEHLGPSACAEQFYNSHPDLMERLKHPWLVQRLTKLIKNNGQRGWPEVGESTQISLPGFKDLPRRIFVKNGARKLLDQATVADIRLHLRNLYKRFKESPRIERMKAILKLMEKHNKIKPRITWKEVKLKELEARG